VDTYPRNDEFGDNSSDLGRHLQRLKLELQSPHLLSDEKNVEQRNETVEIDEEHLFNGIREVHLLLLLPAFNRLTQVFGPWLVVAVDDHCADRLDHCRRYGPHK